MIRNGRAWMSSVCAFSLLLTAGCATVAPEDSWGRTVHWPGGHGLKRAFVQAAGDPQTWAPVVGAALLQLGDADQNASEWLAREQPMFGSNASDRSDTLSDLTTAMYFVTALAAPSATLRDKGAGLAVGVGAISLNKAVTDGLKSSIGRDRPNGRDDRSMPSGHASNAGVSAALAVANLAYLPTPDWLRQSMKVGLYSMAAGASLARVEAGEHYLSDVLVGYSLGHFIAAFMQQAFVEAGSSELAAAFVPVQSGGVVMVSVPIGGN